MTKPKRGRPNKLSGQHAKALIDHYLMSGSISQTARQFGVSRDTARRILNLDGSSTLPEHSVNRELKHPKPLLKYGTNSRGRPNVYTFRTRRANTQLKPAEMEELREEIAYARADADDLEESRRKVRQSNQALADTFHFAPAIRSWIKGRAKFTSHNPCGGPCQVIGWGFDIALDKLVQTCERGWWPGKHVDYDLQAWLMRKGKTAVKRFPNIDPDYPFLPGRKVSKADRAAAAEWIAINSHRPPLPLPPEDPLPSRTPSWERSGSRRRWHPEAWQRELQRLLGAYQEWRLQGDTSMDGFYRRKIVEARAGAMDLPLPTGWALPVQPSDAWRVLPPDTWDLDDRAFRARYLEALAERSRQHAVASDPSGPAHREPVVAETPSWDEDDADFKASLDAPCGPCWD
jgi:hypothetical protein